MDQLETIKRLGTKLKSGVKDRDHLCSLPKILLFTQKKKKKKNFTYNEVYEPTDSLLTKI